MSKNVCKHVYSVEYSSQIVNKLYQRKIILHKTTVNLSFENLAIFFM